MATTHRTGLSCPVQQAHPSHSHVRAPPPCRHPASQGILRPLAVKALNARAPSTLGVRPRHVTRRSQSVSSEEVSAPATSPLQSFLMWLIANGVEGVGGDSSAALFEGENGERGLVAVQDIPEGDVVIRVPMRLALSDFPGDETSEGLVYEGAPWSVRLAARLLRERALGAASAWYPYLQVLPESVPSPLQAFQWDDFKEIQYEPSQEAVHSLNWLISDAYLRLSPESIGAASEEDFQWAISVVHSRTFGSAAKEGGVGVRMMVPLIDMLNHGGDEVNLLLIDPYEPTDTVRWALVPPDTAASGTWEMELRAAVAIAAGTELLLSYGERSAADFFLHYGFLPPRNPYDDVIVFQSIEEALQWHRNRFTIRDEESEESADRAYAAALEAAVAEGCISAADQDSDVTEDAKSAAHIKLLAGCRLDSGLAAAYSSLQASRVGVPPTEVVMAYRSEEMLGEFATGLLADLRLLAFHPGMQAEETMHYKELLQYYTNEGLILAGVPQGMPQQGASRNTNVQAGAAARDGESNVSADVLPLDDQAAEGQSRAVSEEQSEQASGGGPMLSAAHQLALRFRTQKKMMLWDVLIAHGKTMAEKQAAMNSAK